MTGLIGWVIAFSLGGVVFDFAIVLAVSSLFWLNKQFKASLTRHQAGFFRLFLASSLQPAFDNVSIPADLTCKPNWLWHDVLVPISP